MGGQGNAGLLDSFSKADSNTSFPRRREPKCDSPQAPRKKAEHLARKVFRLLCLAVGCSHLDARLRALVSKNRSNGLGKAAWFCALAAILGLLDLFSKATPISSFPRRREPKCDSPQALRKKAKHLARKVFFLSCRAVGDSHLDTRLRGYDEDWNGSWTVVRLRGHDESWKGSWIAGACQGNDVQGGLPGCGMPGWRLECL